LPTRQWKYNPLPRRKNQRLKKRRKKKKSENFVSEKNNDHGFLWEFFAV